MKETLNMECRAYLKSNAITLADAASGVYEASRQNKMDAVCDIVVTLAQRMFEGGWNAAIDYYMQPVKLNREDARRILASEDTGAKHLLSSEIGMLDFCRDHIHAVYRKRGAI